MEVYNELLQRITIREANCTTYINVPQIILLQAIRHYTIFFLVDGSHITVAKHLKHFQTQLSPEIFVRAHHAYLININYACKMVKEDACFVVMNGGKMVPVSRRKKQALKVLLTQPCEKINNMTTY